MILSRNMSIINDEFPLLFTPIMGLGETWIGAKRFQRGSIPRKRKGYFCLLWNKWDAWRHLVAWRRTSPFSPTRIISATWAHWIIAFFHDRLDRKEWWYWGGITSPKLIKYWLRLPSTLLYCRQWCWLKIWRNHSHGKTLSSLHGKETMFAPYAERVSYSTFTKRLVILPFWTPST